MPDVSIMVSAQDNYSSALKKMSQNTKPLSKEVEQLQSRLTALNKNKLNLEVDFSKAKRELSEAEKAFKKTNNAANELKLTSAKSNYNNLKSNLEAVKKVAKETESDMLKLNSTVSKTQNRASDNRGNSLTGLLSTLGSAGAYKMVGDTVSLVASNYVNSAFGSTGATMFGSILSNAASGAAIGTMVGNPVIGAIGGAVLGTVQGATQIGAEKDSSFKDYVQEQYNAVKTEQQNTLTNGSSIAAQREKDFISFSTLLKDETKATDLLSQIKIMANSTPFLYNDLTSISKQLMTYGYSDKEIIPQSTIVGDTGAALGLGVDDMKWIATSMGRMKQSDKTTLEYINILNDRGIGAVEMLAKAKRVSVGDMYDMISDSEIKGSWASDVISKNLEKLYKGSMERQSKTFEGVQSTLTGWKQEMTSAMGEGYNQQSKKNMQEEIEWLSGESGTRITIAYEAEGVWEADLEGSKDRYIREAKDAVMQTDEYLQAESEYMKTKREEDGRIMGRLLKEAEIQGINEYNASEGAQLKLESEKSLIRSIREDAALQSEYWDAGYNLGLEFNKGLASTESGRIFTLSPSTTGKSIFNTNETVDYEKEGQKLSEKNITELYDPMATFKRHTTATGNAFGMNFVPKDNYPAVLHYGEKVLTASQARQMDNGAQGVTVTGNQFIINNAKDTESIARELAYELKIAMEGMKS